MVIIKLLKVIYKNILKYLLFIFSKDNNLLELVLIHFNIVKINDQ